MRRVFLLLVLLLPLPAAAQPAFPPGYDAAQAAFAALPEAERRAIQLALVWTGDYSGLASGEFGRLTFQGLSTFQRRQSVSRPDAILTRPQRAALDQAANRARTAARFETRRDEATGITIGLPLALVDPRPARTPTGTRWAARDNRVVVETLRNPSGDRDLPAYHARLTAPDRPGTVTYQLLRPDFLVVTGTGEGNRRFYTRVNRRGADLVGYAVSWIPERAPEFERISIAIANAFDAGGAPEAPAGDAPAATTPVARAVPPVPPRAASQPAGPLATALVVAPGRAVVPATAVQSCRTPRVGGRPARVPDQPAGTLAVLEVDGLAAAPLPLRPEQPDAGDPLIFLAHGPGGLLYTPARADRGAEGQFAPVLPLQAGQSGGALLDVTGRLVAVVLGPGTVRTAAIGGITLAVPQRVTLSAAVARIAGSQPAPAREPRGTADIVVSAAPAILPFACAP